jgi:predicted metalloendopeptidase
MDVAARDAAGIEPLRPQLAEISALGSLSDLPGLLGRFARTGGPFALFALGASPDLADAESYAMYASSGQFGLSFDSVLAEQADSPRRAAYRRFLADTLTVAGYSGGEADRIAELALEIETELHASKLPPAEAANLANIYNPMSLGELQAQIPELDLSAYLEAAGYPAPERIILTEPDYFPALSVVLHKRSIQDVRDYLALLAIVNRMPLLSTAFDEPTRALQQVLTGVPVLPPREERALSQIVELLGHPVSELYVAAYFPPEAREEADDMIQRVKDAFAERLPQRDWLTESTRDAAAEKLGALSIAVGYPDEWIDLSSVEIGPDLVANVEALAEFFGDRQRARYGGPVQADAFSNPAATLPIVVNAAYDTLRNGFEIPAAILQPPMFDPSVDAAVNFCRIGAVIGHEMTHGFDSNGRQFDAKGDLRDWWTPEDAAAFTAQAQKLVEQADAYEVLPGTPANGPLEVTENMADVGGITLAHQALRSYLADHPDENAPIDGLTPDQRCFLAWAQMWTAKSSDDYVRTLVASDPHPPGPYRAVAPLQHLDAFYAAFGIEPGDPMWLAPEKRVDAW